MKFSNKFKHSNKFIPLKIISSLLTIIVVLSYSAVPVYALSVNGYSNRISRFNTSGYSSTGDKATDLINFAKKQAGKTGSQLGYDANWCAAFVSDCAKYVGCNWSWTQTPSAFKNVGTIIYTRGGELLSEPKAGDIALIDWNNSSFKCGHVEIVTGYIPTSQCTNKQGNGVIGGVLSVGGNTGNNGYPNNVVKNRTNPVNTNWGGKKDYHNCISYIVRPNYNGSSGDDPTPLGTWINSSCGNSTTVGSSVTLTWGAPNAAAYWLHIYKDGVTYYNNGEGSSTSWTHTFTETGIYTCYITPYGKSSYSSSSEGANSSVTITVNAAEPDLKLPEITDFRVSYYGYNYVILEGRVVDQGKGYDPVRYDLWYGVDLPNSLGGGKNIFLYSGLIKETYETSDGYRYYASISPVPSGRLMGGGPTIASLTFSNNYPEYINTKKIGNHTYYLFDQCYTWEDAHNFAKEVMGGDLVSVNSSAENDMLTELIANGSCTSYYTGGIYNSSTGNWTWSDGSGYSYTNWIAGQPSNVGGEADTLCISRGGWFDVPSLSIGNTYGFIVEVAEPQYSITVSDTNNGKVTVSKTSASEDDEIVVTTTPNTGYILDYIKINGITISGNKFIMPAEDTTVEVGFKKLSLSITTQPQDYTGPIGSTAKFNVVAKGTGLKYQWQTYSNGSWVNSSLPGYNTATLSVPITSSRNGYKFRCKITNTNNQSVFSNTATLTAVAPVSITTHPKDYTGIVGSTATFTVVAKGAGLKYQWQTYSNGAWKNSSLTGYNTATLSVPVITSRNGYKFRCVVTDSGNNTYESNAATLHVTAYTAVSITSQPKDYTGNVGNTATFKVVAQGTGLKYQWQTYSNGAWKNSSLTGYNTATLSVPVVVSRNGYKFRCVVTDATNKSVTSNAATLNVVAPTALTITGQPGNYTGSVGSTATFKVTAQGTGLKYQWQTYSNGTWKNSSLPGYNTATLSVPVVASRNGYKFRCVVTDSSNNTATSNAATLNVVVPTTLTITGQPGNYTGSVGSTATFKVVAQGSGLRYQWQTYSDGTWKNSSLSGYNTSTLSVPVIASRNGNKYRCVVSDSSNNTATSNAVTLNVTMTTSVSITTQPKDYTGPVGSTAYFNIVAQGSGLKYQWQTNNGSGSWVNSSLSGSNTAKLSVPVTDSRNGYKFRCIVTDSGNNTATSNVATLYVETSQISASGMCGENLTWKLDNTGTLTISGSGDMYSFTNFDDAPWSAYRDNIKSVVLSDKLNKISDFAFLDCYHITSIVIPDSVTVINFGAFANCENLTNITFGNGLRIIGEYAFSGCRSLKSIELPNSVTEICYYAFRDCNSLTSVVIPDSVTSIDFGAFEDCDSLTDVYYGGTQAQYEEMYISDEFPENVVIHYEEIHLSIMSQPADCSATVGSVAKFKVVAQGNDLDYQWQVNSSGNWVNATYTGATKDTLSVSVTYAYNGYKFRCIVTDASGESVISRVATLSVTNSFSPTTISNTAALGVIDSDEDLPISASEQCENNITITDELVDTFEPAAEDEILLPISEDSTVICENTDDSGTEMEISFDGQPDDLLSDEEHNEKKSNALSDELEIFTHI